MPIEGPKQWFLKYIWKIVVSHTIKVAIIVLWFNINFTLLIEINASKLFYKEIIEEIFSVLVKGGYRGVGQHSNWTFKTKNYFLKHFEEIRFFIIIKFVIIVLWFNNWFTAMVKKSETIFNS